MEHITKREKYQAILTSFIYLAMIFVTAQSVWQKGIENFPQIYVFNIGIEIFAMLTGYMLFISCIIDIQKSGTDLKWFVYMVNTAIWWNFSDAMSWVLDGNPYLRWLSLIDNTIIFFCAPLMAFCFWKYITGMVPMNRPFEKALDKILTYGLPIPILIRIINIFTGMYFYIDPNGMYKRGPLYSLCVVYGLIVLACVVAVVIAERKHLQAYRIAAISLYIVVPFLAVLVNLVVYGISLNAATTMIVITLMYCIINVNQGKEKAAADRDLTVASSIQKNILPMTFPYLPERKEFDIYATMTPAKEVGGDFYDFFMIDDDHIALVIADVSGKGIPAALFMMVSRTLIKNQTQSASSNKDPRDILSVVNDRLCEGNEMELFVTAWLGIVTLSTGQLEYASAGHEYPAISSGGGDFFILKDKNSPPLATMEGLRIRGGSIDLKNGDVVFVYTDGVTEATNDDGELFGLDRMIDALNIDKNAELKDIDSNVRTAIDEFIIDAPQFDDITMLSFRYTGGSDE